MEEWYDPFIMTSATPQRMNWKGTRRELGTRQEALAVIQARDDHDSKDSESGFVIYF